MRSALIAVVACFMLATLATAESVPVGSNCSNIPTTSVEDYFNPPTACVSSDEAVTSCMSSFTECISSSATKCSATTDCYSSKMNCLANVESNTTECQAWSTKMSNVLLYLAAGGNYQDSEIQQECKIGLCNIARSTDCPVFFGTTCTAKSIERPTLNSVTFSITFGGNWDEVLANAPKGSEAYRKLETAVTKGLARLLKIGEYLIVIIDMRVGSLIVDFGVKGDIDVAAATAALESVKNNATLAGSMFQELGTASGVEIVVDGFGVKDPSTTTPSPESNSEDDACDGDCKVIVIVVVFAVVLIVIIVLSVIFGKKKRGTGQEGSNEPSNQDQPMTNV